MNVTFEDLRKRFEVMMFSGLGNCIIIPGELLDLDWILMFLEEGYRFEGTRLDGYPVVLVKVQKLVID